VFTLGVEIKPTVQKRILEAFLDIAILHALRDQALTGYGINGFFMKNFGTTASPSTVYNTLTAMERKGWIKCVRNIRGRAYDLTQQGQKIVDSIPSIAVETHAFIKKVLGS
jgi:DNA-binding PadR family transcriptional regulator